MTIGERIKARREELGMTQLELANKIGYSSRSSINKIELNIQNLKQSKIKAIADALNTTPAYIMGWESDKKIQEAKACELFEKCYGKEAFEIVKKFLSLNDEGRKAVNAMIDGMLPAYTEKESSGRKAM